MSLRRVLWEMKGKLAVVGAVSSVAGFFVWVKHCQFETPLNPEKEALFRSRFFKQFNPRNNLSMSDVCIRRIPLHQLKLELYEDSKRGGTKLIEAFTQGCFGGFNYTPQRLIHQRGVPASDHDRVLDAPPELPASSLSTQFSNISPSSPSLMTRLASFFSIAGSDPPDTSPRVPQLQTKTSEPPAHLWSKAKLLASAYPPGTIITNHFLVLSKTPTSIVVRCGDSPFTSPDHPRNLDGLFELAAIPNFDKGYCEFRMTSLFYDGAAEKPEVMGAGMKFLHRQYTKLWMESAIMNCKMTKWRSQKRQREISREKIMEEKEGH